MLEIVNLTKVFNPSTVNEMVALAGVSLSLNEGDYVAVIGGNGAGKSTLLNAIAGVYPPDGGRIEIDGKDVKSLPEHKRAAFLGRVFQDPMMGTAGDMLIEENSRRPAQRQVPHAVVEHLHGGAKRIPGTSLRTRAGI